MTGLTDAMTERNINYCAGLSGETRLEVRATTQFSQFPDGKLYTVNDVNASTHFFFLIHPRLYGIKVRNSRSVNIHRK